MFWGLVGDLRVAAEHERDLQGSDGLAWGCAGLGNFAVRRIPWTIRSTEVQNQGSTPDLSFFSTAVGPGLGSD